MAIANTVSLSRGLTIKTGEAHVGRGRDKGQGCERRTVGTFL